MRRMRNTPFAAFGFCLAMMGSICCIPSPTSGDVILQEDWSLYSAGDFPSSGGWRLGGNWDNYERYSGNHIVDGISPDGVCMMVSNPYNGWGMHLQRDFAWDPSEYTHLSLRGSLMYPNANSHAVGNNVGLAFQDHVGAIGLDWVLAMGLDTAGSSQSRLNVTAGPAGTGVVLSQAVAYGEWVDLEALLDVSTGTFSLLVNGALRAEDIPLHPGKTALNIDTVRIGKGFWQAGPGYYDSIEVQGITIPEPSTALLAALALPFLLLAVRRRSNPTRGQL